MKIRLGDLKQIISEALGRSTKYFAGRGSFVITAPDGTSYQGDRDAIRVALIQNSRLTGDERNRLLSSGRASSSEIATLKRAGVITRVIQKHAFERQPKMNQSFGEMTHEEAQSAFQNAVTAFASNWTDFANESPDAFSEDAKGIATDAAFTFFNEYPDARKWARAMDMQVGHMRDAVADHVYDAMLGKQ